MKLQDFDYELPKELIAPYPTPKRTEAKLLVVDRKTGRVVRRIFRDILEYLEPGDLLVLNNTKVLPARLFGRKPTGGRVEALLLKPIGKNIWEILVRPNGRVKKGTRISFGENGVVLEGEILNEANEKTGIRSIQFNAVGANDQPPLQETLNQIGRIPLPPYIDRPDESSDRERYQTVFAEKEGAVASPTAGLHFDEPLLTSLKGKGVEICLVTLHVSYGTFQPVAAQDLSKHRMYEEEYEISGEAAGRIRRALDKKRRIVACGTTVVRTLETVGKKIEPRSGQTRLFIYPPYEFKIVDAMITNFHLPRSTLFMLVSAFAGRDLIFRAYEEAVRHRYRFYSYGDAMLIR